MSQWRRHSDSPTHVAAFFDHKDFQDRTVWLWEELAKHYKDNPCVHYITFIYRMLRAFSSSSSWYSAIAGYNPLNEPTDPSHTRLLTVYDRLHSAIRKHDTRHIIYWDGNTFASDFSHFGDAWKRWTNSAYSIHDYSVFGFPDAPSLYTGTEEQKARLRKSFERKMAWMKENG